MVNLGSRLRSPLWQFYLAIKYQYKYKIKLFFNIPLWLTRYKIGEGKKKHRRYSLCSLSGQIKMDFLWLTPTVEQRNAKKLRQGTAIREKESHEMWWGQEGKTVRAPTGVTHFFRKLCVCRGPRYYVATSWRWTLNQRKRLQSYSRNRFVNVQWFQCAWIMRDQKPKAQVLKS